MCTPDVHIVEDYTINFGYNSASVMMQLPRHSRAHEEGRADNLAANEERCG